MCGCWYSMALRFLEGLGYFLWSSPGNRHAGLESKVPLPSPGNKAWELRCLFSRAHRLAGEREDVGEGMMWPGGDVGEGRNQWGVPGGCNECRWRQVRCTGAAPARGRGSSQVTGHHQCWASPVIPFPAYSAGLCYTYLLIHLSPPLFQPIEVRDFVFYWCFSYSI